MSPVWTSAEVVHEKAKGAFLVVLTGKLGKLPATAAVRVKLNATRDTVTLSNFLASYSERYKLLAPVRNPDEQVVSDIKQTALCCVYEQEFGPLFRDEVKPAEAPALPAQRTMDDVLKDYRKFGWRIQDSVTHTIYRLGTGKVIVNETQMAIVYPDGSVDRNLGPRKGWITNTTRSLLAQYDTIFLNLTKQVALREDAELELAAAIEADDKPARRRAEEVIRQADRAAVGLSGLKSLMQLYPELL